ncbi:hypothetical protein CHUAL_006634 [Chamberlinius hualienensis]
MGSQNYFHIVSPLAHSLPLSKKVGHSVFIKCDNCQPSGSFKIRGIGWFLTKKYEEGIRNVVIASGGNAGLATAYAAQKLGMKATVVLPEPARQLLETFKDLGANAFVHGSCYDDSNIEALRIGQLDGYTYVHPFDHPTVWEGHESIVYEIKEQLKGVKPRAIIVSVGGGGLLVGIIQGLKKCGWGDVHIVAMETRGAHSYNVSVEAKQLIPLEELTSIAQCLSTRLVAKRAFEYAVNNEHPITSIVVEDEDALDACFKFLDDHRFLVEPACGAGLSAIYKGIINQLIDNCDVLLNDGPIVAIVCGGSNATLGALQRWKTQLQNKK